MIKLVLYSLIIIGLCHGFLHLLILITALAINLSGRINISKSPPTILGPVLDTFILLAKKFINIQREIDDLK